MESAGATVGRAAGVLARPAEGLDPGPPEAARQALWLLGLWMFLATVTMLFAAFTSAYIVRRSASDWTPLALPGALWVNTALLVASSAALEWGRLRQRSGAVRAALAWVIASMALGLVFLAGQVRVWSLLTAAGIHIPTSPHGSFFYVLTGVHAVHLAAGLILVASLAIAMARPDATRTDPNRRAFLADVTATFWHFFTVVWLYLFALLTWF